MAHTTIPILVRPYSQIAPTYDIAVGIRDFLRTRRAFEALVRRYGIEFRSAVDLGCGTGLFACYLSRCWNVPVFAVDNCPEMLRVAVRNCRDSRVCLLLQDIRRLCLPAKVDLATANTYTLNHLLNRCDMQMAFHRIYQNLRPGGYLLFDLVTHRQPGRSLPHSQPVRIANRAFHQQIRWDPGRKLLSIVIVHRAESPTASKVEVYMGRGRSPLEVGRWLQEAGFTLRGIHDAATLQIATGCPPNIILVAKKEASHRTR
jgi:SAM-dependent methyltransferase